MAALLAATLFAAVPPAAAAPLLDIYDTAWMLPVRSHPGHVDPYFDHLAAVGFSGVWIAVAAPHGGRLGAANHAGQAMGSFDAPNAAYLDYVGFLLDEAAARGLGVGLVVAWANTYVGEAGAAKHGGVAPLREDNAYGYGSLLARRWGGHPAVAQWVLGGDYYEGSDEWSHGPLWSALASGLRDGGATEPIAYHGHRWSAGTLFQASWVNIPAPLTGHCADTAESSAILSQVKAETGKPVIASEMRYEAFVADWCDTGPTTISPADVEADTRVAIATGMTGLVYGHQQRWDWDHDSIDSLGSEGERRMLAVAQAEPILPPSPSNAAPQAAPDAAVVASGGSVTIDVLANDVDPDGDPLTWELTVRPAHGRVEPGPGTSLTYVHGGGTATADTFVYVADDGEARSEPASVTVTVTQPVPPPPPPPPPPPSPPPPPATADALAMFDPATGRWHLLRADRPAESFYYGVPGDVPLLGDWDCDGVATVGMFRPGNGFVYLRNSNDFGIADLEFFYGQAGDVPLVGDWDGDGCDTLAIYRNSEVHVRNTLGTGPGEQLFFFGVPGDRPFAGDFDGDGITTVGLYREATGFVYFRNSLDTGPAHLSFFYGVPSDRIVAGDWDASGDDTVGVFRPQEQRFYLSNRNRQGPADTMIDFGSAGWLPVAGALG